MSHGTGRLRRLDLFGSKMQNESYKIYDIPRNYKIGIIIRIYQNVEINGRDVPVAGSILRNMSIRHNNILLSLFPYFSVRGGKYWEPFPPKSPFCGPPLRSFFSFSVTSRRGYGILRTFPGIIFLFFIWRRRSLGQSREYSDFNSHYPIPANACYRPNGFSSRYDRCATFSGHPVVSHASI